MLCWFTLFTQVHILDNILTRRNRRYVPMAVLPFVGLNVVPQILRPHMDGVVYPNS
jgi:hypothetical protein